MCLQGLRWQCVLQEIPLGKGLLGATIAVRLLGSTENGLDGAEGLVPSADPVFLVRRLAELLCRW